MKPWAVVFFLLVYHHALVAQPVKILGDEWYPINRNPQQPPPGYMVEIAQLAFSEIDYQIVPWNRALTEVRTGRAECLFAADKSEAPDLVFPQLSMGVSRAGIYILANDTWLYGGLNSLQTRRIAMAKGYVFKNEFDGFMVDYAHRFYFNTGSNPVDKNIKQLLSGRVNTVVESFLVMDAKIKTMDVGHRIKRVGFVNEANQLYIGCSPQVARSQQLVDQLDKTLRQLRASGKLAEILARYGLSDWQ